MRLIWPHFSNNSCAAPMSMTANAPPVVRTLPATWTGTHCKPRCSLTVVAEPASACAAALRNTWPGENTAQRSA
jgi:hypothetical protein